MGSQQLLSFPHHVLLSSEMEGLEQRGTRAAHSAPKSGHLALRRACAGPPCPRGKLPSSCSAHPQPSALPCGGGPRSRACKVVGMRALFSGIGPLLVVTISVPLTALWLLLAHECWSLRAAAARQLLQVVVLAKSNVRLTTSFPLWSTSFES